jgi:hypothetical protein
MWHNAYVNSIEPFPNVCVYIYIYIYISKLYVVHAKYVQFYLLIKKYIYISKLYVVHAKYVQFYLLIKKWHLGYLG